MNPDIEEQLRRLHRKVDRLLQQQSGNSHTRYLSAREVQQQYGVSAKTLLNRSNLPATHRRHIPAVRLKGGRKKYFERKVVERLIITPGKTT